MLWLCVYLPCLSMDVFSRGGAAGGPLVVVAGRGARRLVWAQNAEAEALGIRPGTALGAAHALVPGLRVRDRDEAAEQQALAGLAGWAGQFTPVVSLSPRPFPSILLEVKGSLELFGGPDELMRTVEPGVSALGFLPFLSLAPTPLAAELLARAGQRIRVIARGELESHLAPLGFDALDLPKETLGALHGMGLRTLGDCLRLPRAGLVRRSGRGLVDTLDRALGKLPDPRPPFAPPAIFESRLELPAEVSSSEALLFAANRLVSELEGFLRAKGAGVSSFRLTLVHARGEPTRLEVGLASPSREATRLLSLLRERLERTPLRQPVSALLLSGSDLVTLSPQSRDLFQGEEERTGDGVRLLERLRARLGEETVQGICLAAEHRPERASKATKEWTTKAKRREPAPPHFGPRPVWLLETPSPIPEKELTLLDGPERIESGWWDGDDVSRDYFVAEDCHGSRLWVFRERQAGKTGERLWFLHGLFS